jgi:hypothetical protein
MKYSFLEKGKWESGFQEKPGQAGIRVTRTFVRARDAKRTGRAREKPRDSLKPRDCLGMALKLQRRMT